MPRLESTLLAAHIRRMAAPESDALTDGELVGRYAGRRDAAAFEVLVWRHGPMVWATCRRILRHRHDVEDAFQATFLALARSAGTLGSRQAVGGWLHRVAVNAALKLKANRRPTALTEDVPARPERDDREFAGAVDEEVERLPDRLRAAFVLCCLEGMTGAEAARELGCPAGTVDSRLHAARARLRDRLTRRGFGPGALTGLVIVAAPPAAVVAAAVGVGTGTPPAPAVAALATHASRIVTHGAITMKTGIGAVLALALAGTVWAFNSGGAPSVVPKPDPVSAPAHGVIALPPAPVTVWGEPVNGLQAGLRCPAGKQVLLPGESVELELIVRNVSRELIGIEYLAWKNQTGGSVFLSGVPERGELRLGWSVNIHGNPGKDSVLLGAGEEIVRGQVTLVHGKVGPVPAGTRPPIGLSAGAYRVTVDPVGEPTFDRLGWPGGVAFPRLGTGVLELTLLDAMVRAAPVPPALDEEVAKLQGEWVVVAWEDEGRKAPLEDLKGKNLVITGNELTGIEPGLTGKMSFKLDPGKTPKAIDLTALDGNLKGTTSPGIYAIEDQKLRVCFGGKVRPTKFTTAPGDGRTMITLEKVTPTAWGKEVGGLQAGLALVPADARTYRPGDTVNLEVKLRNVGKADVTITYGLLHEHPPVVSDAEGNRVHVTMPPRLGIKVRLIERVIKAGETITLYDPEVAVEAENLKPHPGPEPQVGAPTIRARPGTYKIAFAGMVPGHPALATGTAEFEVREPTKPVTTPKTPAPLAPGKTGPRQPGGILGDQLGKYLTIEGVLAEGGKIETGTILVDTVDGKKLNTPTPVLVRSPGYPTERLNLPARQRCIFKGYESGEMIGIPPAVLAAAKEQGRKDVPISPKDYQWRPYFVALIVVEPKAEAPGK